MKTTLISLAIATILTGPLPALAAGKVQMTMPDFTKGEAIPAGATHDWNLGGTGARLSLRTGRPTRNPAFVDNLVVKQWKIRATRRIS